MASERKAYDPRLNGGGARLAPSAALSHPPYSSRQSSFDVSSTDVDSFELTRFLGEASYKYAKMKDAEIEKTQVENDWTKNSQHFDSNPKLKETYDIRRSKAERKYGAAKQDYVRAARDAEPLLRRIEDLQGGDLWRDMRDQVNRMISTEMRERGLVTLRRLEDQIENAEARMIQETDSRRKDDLRDFVRMNEFDRLSDQVKNMNFNSRNRQRSVSSDHGSREVDQRPQPKIENLWKDLSKEVRDLNDRIGNLQKEIISRPEGQISSTSSAQAEGIVRIETAMEKAQEVINDQYVRLHDLRLQLDSVLEGIRVLNEHIKEYDVRLDGLQSGTQKFLAEVKAEDERRNAILNDAFEILHNKIMTDVNTKIVSSPKAPPSTSFPSPYPSLQQQQQLPPTRPPQQILDIHAKSIQDAVASLNTVTGRIRDLESQVNPNLVPKPYIDAMNARLAQAQMEIIGLRNDHNSLGTLFGQFRQSQALLNQNTENNFRETAMHMDSVKRRFGEHRQQLDTLITAYESSQDQMDNLIGQHTQLREMFQNRVVPMLTRIVKQFPEILEDNPVNAGQNQRADSTALVDRSMSYQAPAAARTHETAASPHPPTMPNRDQSTSG